MFGWLVFADFVCTTAFSVCAPILPVELTDKGISEQWIGFTFTVYSIGTVFWSPIVGKYMVGKFKAHDLLGYSLIVLGISFMAFGTIKYLHDTTIIILVNCLLRLIQGIS